MKRALFIFRRDLRLLDNRGLSSALKQAKEVILAFIFTEEQIHNNPFRSDAALQFMLESLQELSNEVTARGGKLFFFYGKPHEIIEKCIDDLGVQGVFVNRDYTPYSLLRDSRMELVCKKRNIAFCSSEDLLLHPIVETVKRGGDPYTIFTPFYHHLMQFEVEVPNSSLQPSFFRGEIDFSKPLALLEPFLPFRKVQQKGGRSEALKIFSQFGSLVDYEKERDFPAQDKTSHLSPHLKFGTISSREVYSAVNKHFGKNCALIRSLYWRDFFTLIAHHFPHVFQGAFKRKFDALVWRDNREYFERWCEGKTGYPIVDAGMRELKETGFMHNRVRMIVASFLVNDLHIDWHLGERYFASQLIDYDPAVNNGNWQWAASTGCDAKPYFRVFNPFLQGLKFDKEAKYIKKWVSELRAFSSKEIHKLNDRERELVGYSSLIVDHATEAKVSIESYKKI